jgi:hypothetical protein
VTAAPAAVAAPASSTTGTASFRLRPRLVHHQIASTEILPVQRIDRAICFFVISDFNEGKPARLSRKTITNQIHC